MSSASIERMMKIIAAILAGGRSSRMGKSKALLEFDGVPLVDRMFKTLSELKPQIDEIVISGSLPKRITIEDEKPFSGPVEGIRMVAKSYLGKAETLLVVPVDLPLLDANSLRPLMSTFEKEKPSALSFLQNPLPAIFRLDKELIRLCEKHTSVHGLLERLKASCLAVSNTAFLTNTNTPQEWAKIIGANL